MIHQCVPWTTRCAYVITLALRHPLSMGLSVGGACLHSGFHLCFRLILSSQPFPRGLQFSSTYGVINNECRRMELTMASWTMSNPESQMVVKSRAKIIQVVKTLTTDLKVVTYTSSWPKSKHTTAASSDFLWQSNVFASRCEPGIKSSTVSWSQLPWTPFVFVDTTLTIFA